MAAISHAERSPRAAALPVAIVCLACVAQFMLLIDDTITNVALPTIGSELHMGESSLSWVVNAYLLTFGGFLLVGGRLADRFGARRVFAVSLACFALASALCGLAPSAGVLVAARAGQGIAAGLLSPAALAILLAACPEGPARRRALSIWTALMGLGAATGLLAGGALVQGVSWRWIFLINLPVAAGALLATARVLPARSGDDRRPAPNVGGAALATLALLLLVFTVVETDHAGWGSPRTLLGLAGAVLLALGFAFSERRSSSPLLPPELLRRPRALSADAVVFLGAGGLLAMFFFQTLYLQRVLGLSPLGTGLAFLPFSVTMGIASALVSRLPERVDARIPIVFGFLLSAAGLGLMARLAPASAYAGDVLPALALLGCGLGTALVPVMALATGGAEERDGGLASGLMTTAQQIGGAIGIAVLTTIASTATDHAARAGSAVPAALTHGFTTAFGVQAIVMLVAAAVAVAALRRRRSEAPAAAVF